MECIQRLFRNLVQKYILFIKRHSRFHFPDRIITAQNAIALKSFVFTREGLVVNALE